ncbi:MAG: hypothetical protein JJT94_08360 [Bernardetiaceae bacterium]|nr:hypothetical protein [Bernardetiaceae bacterium]
MRTILILCLTFYSHLFFGQDETMFQKGQFQITVAFSLMPIKKTNSQVDFKYIDGDQNVTYLVDSISANYNLKKRYFANAVTIGVGYFITDNIRTSINIKPYLNSFLSNKAKNGQVYGVQFDLGLDYFASVSDDVSISFGTTASRIIGGFGITSSGAKNKEYLVVNGNELYDNDIGFHIIDNSWAFSPTIGLHYRASSNIILSANSGFQMTFGRTSRMNFAGLQQDETVKWNRKEYNNADVSLMIDGTKINNDNINKLPYKFSGVFFELGTIINLNK